jgi:uncharacterized membrane protein YfcA
MLPEKDIVPFKITIYCQLLYDTLFRKRESGEPKMKDLLWWIAGATATWLVLGFFLKDYDAEGLIFVVVSFIVTYFLQKRREENAE